MFGRGNGKAKSDRRKLHAGEPELEESLEIGSQLE
jgi:hypothetical protein